MFRHQTPGLLLIFGHSYLGTVKYTVEKNGVKVPLFTQYSLRPMILIQTGPQPLKVLLQARVSFHLGRKSRSVLAQGRYAHPAYLPADLEKTLLPLAVVPKYRPPLVATAGRMGSGARVFYAKRSCRGPSLRQIWGHSQ
jgi:hypothetical protein